MYSANVSLLEETFYILLYIYIYIYIYICSLLRDFSLFLGVRRRRRKRSNNAHLKTAKDRLKSTRGRESTCFGGEGVRAFSVRRGAASSGEENGVGGSSASGGGNAGEVGDWCRAITVAEVQTSREFERRPVAVRASSTSRRVYISCRDTEVKIISSRHHRRRHHRLAVSRRRAKVVSCLVLSSDSTRSIIAVTVCFIFQPISHTLGIKKRERKKKKEAQHESSESK